jgi:hypothetical protein
VNKSPFGQKSLKNKGFVMVPAMDLHGLNTLLKIFEKNFIFFEPNGNELRLNS